MEGGFISKVERDCAVSSDDTDIFLRDDGEGERDSCPGLGGTLNGDWDRGDGGGRRGLFGRSGRPGNGFFGGSIGLETFFKERRVSFFRKSVNKACRPDA